MSDPPPGLVAVPCELRLWTRTAVALLRVHGQLPSGAGVSFMAHGCTIAKKRNALVRQMLEDPEYRWMLCLDSDMTPPDDVAHRLWRTAEEEGADLVQAAMVQKVPPHEPVGARVLDRGQPPNPLCPATSDPSIRYGNPTATSLAEQAGPVEMDVAGTGCLLVRRRVFDVLGFPWFTAHKQGTGSDYNFTLRATDAGFRLVLDPRVRVGHVADYSYGLDDAVRCDHKAEA